jgi:hypothetical protein
VAEPEALIFLHVPKTAGSSLSAILEEQYTRERSYSTSFSGHHPNGSLDAWTRFHALPPARVGAAAVPILALPPAAGQQASPVAYSRLRRISIRYWLRHRLGRQL